MRIAPVNRKWKGSAEHRGGGGRGKRMTTECMQAAAPAAAPAAVRFQKDQVSKCLRRRYMTGLPSYRIRLAAGPTEAMRGPKNSCLSVGE